MWRVHREDVLKGLKSQAKYWCFIPRTRVHRLQYLLWLGRGEGGGSQMKGSHIINGSFDCTFSNLTQFSYKRYRKKCHSYEELCILTFVFKCGLCPGWVAQLVGAWSRMPKGCGFDPWTGHVREAIGWCFFLSHIDISFSLKSINKSLGED